MPKDIDRKIAVIFVTDVVGFSKSMENSEKSLDGKIFDANSSTT